MSQDSIPYDLSTANFTTPGADTKVAGIGYLRAWGVGAPTDGLSGYAPGCIYQDLTASTGELYRNAGTSTSTVWNKLGDHA